MNKQIPQAVTISIADEYNNLITFAIQFDFTCYAFATILSSRVECAFPCRTIPLIPHQKAGAAYSRACFLVRTFL